MEKQNLGEVSFFYVKDKESGYILIHPHAQKFSCWSVYVSLQILINNSFHLRDRKNDQKETVSNKL